jgi:hypothetical protein
MNLFAGAPRGAKAFVLTLADMIVSSGLDGESMSMEQFGAYADCAPSPDGWTYNEWLAAVQWLRGHGFIEVDQSGGWLFEVRAFYTLGPTMLALMWASSDGDTSRFAEGEVRRRLEAERRQYLRVVTADGDAG